MPSNHVLEVTTQDFETQVVAKSHEVPVLLDFWAEWCGPCRTLSPLLERLAEEYGGAFVLGKVDTEAEQDLAYAFQVRSIPLCVLLARGKPVDAFTGAIGEREVRAFLARAGIEPASTAAQEPQDPDSSPARLQAGRAAATRGDVAEAQDRLSGIPEEDQEHASAQRILDGLPVLAVEDSATPAGGALARGRDLIRSGDYPGAAEALLESVAANKAFADSLARRALVLCFELMGGSAAADDRVAELRRRLATLLF